MSDVSAFQRAKRALSRQRQKARSLRRRVSRIGTRPVGTFVDLSSNNGPITEATFRSYAKHHDLIAIKATEGTDYTNPYFALQVKMALAEGLIVMPYHFARPDKNPAPWEAEKEAAHFVRTCKAAQLSMGKRHRLWFRRRHLPGCLDYETAHPEGKDVIWEASFTHRYRRMTRHGVARWQGQAVSAGEGPVLYGGSVIREHFSRPLKRLFWLAAYVPHPGPYWPSCIPKNLRMAWQWTEASKQGQGLGLVDASHFYGSISALVGLAI